MSYKSFCWPLLSALLLKGDFSLEARGPWFVLDMRWILFHKCIVHCTYNSARQFWYSRSRETSLGPRALFSPFPHLKEKALWGREAPPQRNQSTHAGIKCLAFLTLAMEQRANTSFSAYLAHRAYWKKLSLRYVWWPRTANRKILILKEYEFKTLFNVHLHRSFKKVIFLPKWKPVIRHLRASSRERVVNTTKSTWRTQCMLVVAALDWDENFIWF